MRRHWLLRVILIAVCLCLPASLVMAADPSSPLIGRWSLVGFGEVSENAGGPEQMVIDIHASGSYDYQVTEEREAEPFKVTGDWTVKDDVLKMVPRDGKARKLETSSYRIRWDRGILVLSSVDEDDRSAPPLRFAMR